MATVRGLRRFHSRFFSSSSSSSQAATEISDLVSRSNIEQPGRPSAAPFTSERPIRRRVSTADRKAMLESFVHKYRDMNMGKFPSATCAQKEVGGCYYVIKKILQEIEYDFRISSVEKGLIKDHKKQTEGENTTGMEISTELSGSQEVANSQITSVQPLCNDPWKVNSSDNEDWKEVLCPSPNSDNARDIKRDDTCNRESHDTKGCHEKLEQKPEYEFPMECHFLFEELQSKVENQQDVIRNIATETHDTVVQCYEKQEQKPEQKPKGESPLEDKSVYEDSQSKVERQTDEIENIATENCDIGQYHGKVELNKSPLEEKFVPEDLQSKAELHHDGIRNINRDMPEQQKDDELRKKPSLWGNLKSLATDFINMWKY